MSSLSEVPETGTGSVLRCVNHPDVPADARCGACSAAICPTCAFSGADGAPYCPSCAVAHPPLEPREWMLRQVSEIRALSFHDTGPYTFSELRSKLAKGEAKLTDLVMRVGQESYTVMAEIPAFNPSTPPSGLQEISGLSGPPGMFAERDEGRSAPADARCGTHPGIAAAWLCNACGEPICTTCEFGFAGGVHLCPRCVSASNKKVGKNRRGILIWSYALAVWSTLGVVAMFSGVLLRQVHSQSDQELLGYVVFLFLMVPSLVGAALAVSALDRHLRNPPAIWVSAAWNGSILGLWILLTIIGSLK